MTPQEAFRSAIESAGLVPPDSIVADGELHRFASNGERGDDAGWYVLFGDGVPAGSFGCWRAGVKEVWRATLGRELSAREAAEHAARVEKIRREREADQTVRHAEACHTAFRLWQSASPAMDGHPYLVSKAVKAHGIREHGGRLLIPVRDGTEIQSLQIIGAGGDKRFLPGGRVKGCYFAIGKPNGVVCIAEGYATAASIYESTGHACAVAFTAGNLLAVALAINVKFPHARIVMCADDDCNAGNPGLTKATEAARAAGCVIAVPNFGDDRPEGATDFNDLTQHSGAEAVRRAIANARVPGDAEPKPEVASGPAGDAGNALGQPAYALDENPAEDVRLLDDLLGFLQRFIAYPSREAAIAHALWIAHAHLMDEWESTPRLAFLSPEPGSGKTRALEVTETLVPRPVASVNATPAYLFRKVADPDGRPTILYDEIDTVFGPKARDNEEVRGLINAGHRRGATAGRCVVRGKIIETEELEAYCAVAVAGIGNVPDTITTRSVVIRMRKRAPHEHVEQYRVRVHAPEGRALRERLVRWSITMRGIGKGYPAMPDGVTDRAADVWEPLLAVADAVGGRWPERARVSAVSLVSLSTAGGLTSLGVRLLSDLRSVFGTRDTMTTETILEALGKLDEAPWADLKGKPLGPRDLAGLLKPYGVAPKQIRIGAATTKGYKRADLQDPWSRYLKPPSPQCETCETIETAELVGVEGALVQGGNDLHSFDELSTASDGPLPEGEVG